MTRRLAPAMLAVLGAGGALVPLAAAITILVDRAGPWQDRIPALAVFAVVVGPAALSSAALAARMARAAGAAVPPALGGIDGLLLVYALQGYLIAGFVIAFGRGTP